MFARRNRTDSELQSDRLSMRPPQMRDFEQWVRLRRESQAFLSPWEPSWSRDHLTSRAFRNRVVWAERAIRQNEAFPLFLFRQKDGQIIGGITLSNIRRQPAQAATLGYWVGEAYAMQGYMTEALSLVRDHAFSA
jgi:ribosomal-protein-alanine N-acetyltransferase